MDLVEHPDGGYGYAPGIAPYSAGVRASAGHRIRRVMFREPPPWRDGFVAIDGILAEAGRPARALCSIELRCPAPHSFDGFGTFNDDYRVALSERGVLLEGGVNPVARTNVAPGLDPPTETRLFAFGFTIEAENEPSPSFVLSGAGDLSPQADLRPEAIVGGDRPWSETGADRAAAVVDHLAERLTRLSVTWGDTDSVAVYSVEDVHTILAPVVLDRLGPAAGRGVHWYWARPPIEGLLFEMDARGGVEDGTTG